MRTVPRIVVTLLVLAGAAGAIVGTGVIVDLASGDRAFVIDAFDREVFVRTDGVLEVVETVDVTFTEERRGIFRDLEGRGPGDRRVFYEVEWVDRGPGTAEWEHRVERTDDGDPRIRVGNAAVFLDPGPQRYRFGYTIDGLVYRPDASQRVAEIRLDVPGDAWPTTVAETTLTVDLPAAPTEDVVCVVGRGNSSIPCPDAPRVEGTRVIQTLPALRRHETGTVAILLPSTAFDDRIEAARTEPLGSEVTSLPVRRDLSTTGALLLLAAMLAAPVLLLEAGRAWFVYRDRVTDPALHDRPTPTAELVPPDRRSPAEVAGLLRRGSSRDWLLATLVDLEGRGVVQSTTSGEGKGSTIRIEPADTTAPLRPWEADALRELLPNGRAITFDGSYDEDTASRVSAAEQIVAERARHEVSPGSPLFHDRGQLFRGGSGSLLVLLLLATWVGLGWASTAMFGISWLEVGIVALILLFAWGTIGTLWTHVRLPLSSEGRDVVARAQAFRTFLETVHADRLEFAAGQGVQTRHPVLELLPHAIALSLAASWYARFGPMMAELARSGQTPGNENDWYLHHGAFVGASSTVSSSVTAPSTSSGGGSFGGGGGGSGGGGGGGGSW